MAHLLAHVHYIDDALSAWTGRRYRSAGFIVVAGLCLCALALCYAVYVRYLRRGGRGARAQRDAGVPIRVAVWPSAVTATHQAAARALLDGLKDALADALGRAVHVEVVAVCLSVAALVDALAVSELAARCGLDVRLLLLDTLREPPDGAWISVARVKVRVAFVLVWLC